MKLPKIISQEEFEKLIKAEPRKDYQLAYVLGFEAGMRISEVIGLKNKEGKYKIQPLDKSQIDKVAIRILQGKGGKDRVVPRPKRVNEKALSMLPLKIGRRSLQKRITKLGLEVLNKKITFHMLRHGFANHLVNEKGMSLNQVQILLGHSKLATTEIYLHANPKEAIDRARELF